MPDHNPAPPPVAKKRRTNIQLLNTTIAVYSGKGVGDALAALTANMKVYEGIKLSQILDAVYQQGKKDGAREVVEGFEKMASKISYRNPGQPKKRK